MLVRLGGRRKQIDDLVHEPVHSGAGGGVARHEGDEAVACDSRVHAALDLVGGESLAVEELHHQLFIRFCDHLHELVLELGCLRFEGGGDGRALAVEGEALSGEDVDIPRHLAAFHDGQLDGNDLVVFRGDRVDGGHEVRIFLVDGVDENESGHSLFKAHLESFLGADGERTGRAGDDDGAVGGCKCRDHLALEVEKAGDVEDVDLDVVPHGVGECHADGYFALDLFVVIVHRCGAVVHFAQTVDRLGHVEHRFGERSLALTGVTDERDVADKFGCKSLHGIPLIDFSKQ